MYDACRCDASRCDACRYDASICTFYVYVPCVYDPQHTYTDINTDVNIDADVVYVRFMYMYLACIYVHV